MVDGDKCDGWCAGCFERRWDSDVGFLSLSFTHADDTILRTTTCLLLSLFFFVFCSLHSIHSVACYPSAFVRSLFAYRRRLLCALSLTVFLSIPFRTPYPNRSLWSPFLQFTYHLLTHPPSWIAFKLNMSIPYPRSAYISVSAFPVLIFVVQDQIVDRGLFIVLKSLVAGRSPAHFNCFFV